MGDSRTSQWAPWRLTLVASVTKMRWDEVFKGMDGKEDAKFLKSAGYILAEEKRDNEEEVGEGAKGQHAVGSGGGAAARI